MVESKRAHRLPSVSVVGSYQLQGQADDRQLGSYNWPRTSFLGLQTSIPIFTGIKINSSIRQSNIRTQASELTLQDATERAKTEVASLENKLKEVLQRLTVFKRTVEATTGGSNVMKAIIRITFWDTVAMGLTAPVGWLFGFNLG